MAGGQGPGPAAGVVRFGDRVTTGLRPHQVTALGVERALQNIALFGGLSVEDNVTLGRQVSGDKEPL